MNVFVKSRKDFSTTYMAVAQSWDVPFLSSTNETGTVSIPKGKRKDFSGDWLYLDGHLFLIDESSPEDGYIDLKVSDPANLFSRKLYYPDNPASTYGAFIADAIEHDFINCEDSAYAISYLSILDEDDTTFEPPELTDTRLYSLVDIINKAREKGVILDFRILGKTLLIHIYTPAVTPHNVIFSDGHSALESETFSRVKNAKITVLKPTGTSGVYDTTTWYLSVSGEVSQTVPENRADGDWIYLQIEQEEDPETKAKEEFKKNISSHKIEFYSDREFNLWDTVKFKIDDEVLTSSIIAIKGSSDNNRHLYQCGDLATTLTEKVQKIS